MLVDRYHRPKGYQAVAQSLPGHLIQLAQVGRTQHEVNGRKYELCPGDLIWYHEDETVLTEVHKPFTFYTLNFIAPSLPPPPFEHRVQQVGPAVREAFAELLSAWRDKTVPPEVRGLMVHGRLNLLVALVMRADHHARPFKTDPSAQLWWQLETRLRHDLSQPISITRMSQMAGRSAATIARSCHAAVGTAPMKRIKHIRMSLARGLVQRSDLTISMIADRVGYGRVHEFSRDYRKHFQKTPSEERDRRT